MGKMLKQVLIALGLLLLCIALLAGVKSYGVWVISAVAVVLFVIGILRKEKPAASGPGQETEESAGPQPGAEAPKRDGNDGS